MIIQIIGLPGSGKTELAKALKERINAIHLNADEVRATVNSDLGFRPEDRIEQARRMGDMARLIAKQGVAPVIVDFICPTDLTRAAFGKPDILVWVDRIDAGRFDDTNKAFVPPEVYDFRVTEQNADKWAEFIGNHILENRQRPVFDWQKETVQMLGRWQPWHAGHRALFDRLIRRTGQVVIQIRDCQGWQGSCGCTVCQVCHASCLCLRGQQHGHRPQAEGQGTELEEAGRNVCRLD